MCKLNKEVKKYIIGGFILLLASSAMADPNLNPWAPNSNPTAMTPTTSQTTANPFPVQQSQSFQNMQQQLQQIQQAYVNANSLNPTNYNLPPAPSSGSIPTPAPNPSVAPNPTALSS
jgi:hypothetical protein